MQMTDEHWCKMAKKGHPSPGFEPAPLEGSKKVKNFCLKLYHCTLNSLVMLGLMKFIHVENMVVSLIFCSRGLN